MKHKARPLFASFAAASTNAVICATFSMVLNSHADTIDRLNTTDTLDLPAAWSTGVVPTGTDIARWTNAINGFGSTVGIAANVTFGELLMQNTTAITVAGPSLLTLNGVSGVGIDMTAATQNVTVSAPLILGANQNWLVGPGRNLAVTGGISGGASGFTVQGYGSLTVSAAIANSFSGTMGINGANMSFTNSATVLNNIFSASSSLSLAGGYMRMNNVNSGGHAEQFAATSIGQGASEIRAVRTSGGSPVIRLGNLTRSGVGGTVNLNASSVSGGSGIITNTSNTNGIIGGWAYFGVNRGDADPADFAANGATPGTSILVLPAHVANTWAPANNTDVTTSSSVTDGLNTNSLRFNTAAASTVTLLGTSQISSGGILVTSTVAANNQVITGGTLKGATNGGLIVYQNSSIALGGAGTLSINSEIADATSTALTKAGAGILILGGNNTFTGGVYINAGEVRLNNTGALNSTIPNPVTFTNGNAIEVKSQTLSLNGQSVTVNGLNTTAVVATGTATPTVQNINPSTAATLTLDTAVTATFGGAIQNGLGSAALGLTKTGVGNQNLTGVLSHTGATTVNGGTLKLGAPSNLSASSIVTVGSAGTLDVTSVTGGLTIASGKTLSGSGTILGSVTLGNGSITTPGGAGNIGTLFVDSLTVNSGSTTNFEIGAGNDVIDVSTALTIDPLSTGGLSLLTTAGAQVTATGSTYTLFDYTGATLSGFSNLNSSVIVNPVGGLIYTFADTGSHITLTIGGTPSNNANWIQDGATGNWSSTGNWSTGIVPTSAQDAANFFATSPNNPAHGVVLDSNRTVGSVNFNSATSYSVTGASTLSLNNGPSNASISDVSGNHLIATPINLVSSTNLSVSGAADTLTISGNIGNTAGTPSVGKFGNGTVVLSGTNTYSGSTTVNVGTLRFAKQTALYNNNPANWTETKFTVNSGATAVFNVGGAGEFTSTDIETLSALGTDVGGFKSGSIIGLDTTNAGGMFTYSNFIANTDGGANVLGLAKVGSGALVIDQSNNYSGGTTLQTGALHLNNGQAIGSGSLTVKSGTTLDNSSGGMVFLANNPQVWNGNFTFAGTNDLYLGTGAVTLAADTALTVGAGVLATGGPIGGSFGLVKTGAGKLIVTGAGSYLGTTTVSGGTLQIGDGGGAGGLPGTQIINDSVLAYNTTSTLAVNSLITGAGSVTVATGGGNQINFNNTANSFSGGVTVAAGGRLALGNSGTGTYLGTGALTLSGGMFIGSNPGSNNKTFAQNIVLTAATDNLLETVGSTVLTLTGNISGGGSLTRVGGNGVLVFSNADNSSFTGTFATTNVPTAVTFTTTGSGSSSATWDFSNPSVTFARTVTLQALAGGTIDFGTLNATIATPAFNNTITNVTSAATIRVGAGNYGGLITGLAGANAISLTKVGAGTFTLTGANSYSGLTTIKGGTLNINGVFALGGANYAGTTFDGGTLQYATAFSGNGNGDITQNSLGAAKNVTIAAGGATIDTNGNDVAFANTFGNTGTGAVTKTGAGTLTLNGASTYTGNTFVSQGVLQVNGNGVAATGAVSVSASSTLKGDGTLGGAVTVNGLVAPGSLIGNLAVAAATFNTGSELDIEINDASTPRTDKLTVAGALDITNAKLKLTTTGSLGLPVYVIARYGSLVGTQFATVENLPPGATINYAYNDGVDSNNIAIINPVTAYVSWTVDKGLTPGDNDGPTQDPDKDGIANLLEFVLGGNPLASSTGILPTVIPNPTNFVFTFSRSDESEAEAALTFQYGSDLAGWTDVAIGAADALPVVGVAENLTSSDTVTVTIPKGANTKLFGRLKAVKIP